MKQKKSTPTEDWNVLRPTFYYILWSAGYHFHDIFFDYIRQASGRIQKRQLMSNDL